MRVILKPVFLVFLISLPRMSFAWTKLNHQMLCEISIGLASNDGGDEFRAAKIVLDRNREILLKAVIAPDEDKSLWPPISLHAQEAMLHCNFLGKNSEGSQEVAHTYYRRAVEKWDKGDLSGALFDLGCVLHLVQDASFCGHSNSLFFNHLTKHSAFENWVEKQTAPNKKPKSFEELWMHGWVIKSGGCYLKSPWRDDQRRPHWEGGPEAWIDVAAHLSYGLVTYSMGLDYADCEFQGQARIQFVTAQRCGAGLLVDFFREVGLVPKLEALAVECKESGSWPDVSPNGISKLSCHQIGGKSVVNVNANKTGSAWKFPNEDCFSMPKKVSRAFYLGNYFIALVDAAEGDNWRHLYLLPSVPHPDNWYNCPEDDPKMQYFFDSRELSKYNYQIVTLP